MARGEPGESGELPSRAIDTHPDAIDVIEDAAFSSSLVDDQDEQEALDLIDDGESWPDEMLGPALRMPEYPDDGERRRELRRLYKLRTSPNEQQQGEPGSAHAGEPPEAKRMEGSGRSTSK